MIPVPFESFNASFICSGQPQHHTHRSEAAACLAEAFAVWNVGRMHGQADGVQVARAREGPNLNGSLLRGLLLPDDRALPDSEVDEHGDSACDEAEHKEDEEPGDFVAKAFGRDGLQNDRNRESMGQVDSRRIPRAVEAFLSWATAFQGQVGWARRTSPADSARPWSAGGEESVRGPLQVRGELAGAGTWYWSKKTWTSHDRTLQRTRNEQSSTRPQPQMSRRWRVQAAQIQGPTTDRLALLT
eukprot:3710002-Rhodomonas_salina.4